MTEKRGFTAGLRGGLPICLGYLSVAFAFGIYTVGKGLSPTQAVMISMTNVTSAGQLAGVDIIAGGGGLWELILSQFVINLRYSLMSVSLSQKFDGSVRMSDRFALAFVNTDEVFAVASSETEKVGRRYMYGLILLPYLGWSVGTLLGAVCGDIFPASITNALGVAIYGMFIAIVLPESKKDRSVAWCVTLAVLLSCVFWFLLPSIPRGFAIILCAVAACTVFAVIDCVKGSDLPAEQTQKKEADDR